MTARLFAAIVSPLCFVAILFAMSGCQTQQEHLAKALELAYADREKDLPTAAFCDAHSGDLQWYLRDLHGVTMDEERQWRNLAPVARTLGVDHPEYQRSARMISSIYDNTRKVMHQRFQHATGWSSEESAYCVKRHEVSHTPNYCQTPNPRASVLALDTSKIDQADLATYEYCRHKSLQYLAEY